MKDNTGPGNAWAKSFEQFGVASKSDKFHNTFIHIKPYQQEVVLDMALHISFVFPNQQMGIVFDRNRPCILQMIQYRL